MKTNLKEMGLQAGSITDRDLLAAFAAADEGGVIQASQMVRLSCDPRHHTAATLRQALIWLGCVEKPD